MVVVISEETTEATMKEAVAIAPNKTYRITFCFEDNTDAPLRVL
jgi:hypothetical protein